MAKVENKNQNTDSNLKYVNKNSRLKTWRHMCFKIE